jgi:hypothetical protein
MSRTQITGTNLLILIKLGWYEHAAARGHFTAVVLFPAISDVNMAAVRNSDIERA